MMTQTTEPLNPMAVYAEGIDSSNYIENVTPVIKLALTNIGDLLDIGAGGGQLGCSLQTKNNRWVAVEPDPYMCDRLSNYANCTQVISSAWQHVNNLAAHSFDTVLAANMIAPQADAINFLERCRFWTRNTIIWLVPSQRGPKQLCLAGCLPTEWINEDNQTGYERVMSQLQAPNYPNHTLTVDWTFTYVTSDIEEIATHMANRLGWHQQDDRRQAMRDHLSASATQQDEYYYLQVPKQSTILIWTNQ